MASSPLPSSSLVSHFLQLSEHLLAEDRPQEALKVSFVLPAAKPTVGIVVGGNYFTVITSKVKVNVLVNLNLWLNYAVSLSNLNFRGGIRLLLFRFLFWVGFVT